MWDCPVRPSIMSLITRIYCFFSLFISRGRRHECSTLGAVDSPHHHHHCLLRGGVKAVVSTAVHATPPTELESVFVSDRFDSFCCCFHVTPLRRPSPLELPHLTVVDSECDRVISARSLRWRSTCGSVLMSHVTSVEPSRSATLRTLVDSECDLVVSARSLRWWLNCLDSILTMVIDMWIKFDVTCNDDDQVVSDYNTWTVVDSEYDRIVSTQFLRWWSTCEFNLMSHVTTTKSSQTTTLGSWLSRLNSILVLMIDFIWCHTNCE